MPANGQPWWEKAARREDLHWFCYNGRAFLLDTNSGAVCEIDDVTVALLEALVTCGGDPAAARAAAASAFREAEVTEAWEELAALHRAGLLLGPDPLARVGTESAGAAAGRPARAFAVPGVAPPALPHPGWVKALCLNVAHACNLRCRYCFAGQGRFGAGPELMSWTVGRAAVDFLLAQAPPGAELEIDFFGGEPLLNFSLVRALLHYGATQSRAQGKVLRFTLTTNGLLLDEEKLDLLNRYQVQLILSLDGRPAVHDRYRVFPDGRGSYAAVLPRVQAAVAARQGENYFIRGTFTRANLNFSEDVAHLVALGLRRLSLEPVVAAATEDFALRPEDLPVLAAEYDRVVALHLEEQAAGRPFTFFHFQIDLEPGLCLPKRLQGCGAGYQYLAVAPGGELYPCHQLVGQPAFLLGSVQQGVTNRRLQEQFLSLHVLNKTCRHCWARYFCGGGCHAANLSYGGRMEQPYALACSLVKKRLECAIYLKASGKDQVIMPFTGHQKQC